MLSQKLAELLVVSFGLDGHAVHLVDGLCHFQTMLESFNGDVGEATIDFQKVTSMTPHCSCSGSLLSINLGLHGQALVQRPYSSKETFLLP